MYTDYAKHVNADEIEETEDDDLLDIKPLIKETENSLKISFDLPKLILASLEFMKKRMGLSSKEKVNTSSGHSAHNTSSGNFAHNTSSGLSAKNASSGISARNASSGISARNTSSGESAHNTSSGNFAQNVSSGHYAQNVSSGRSAKNVSSGHYAQNVSSGRSARDTVTGKKSVVASIGKNSRIKAVIGTWITLAEYDDNGHVNFVKTGQVDGEIIKENVWYKLENKEFTEVKNNG